MAEYRIIAENGRGTGFYYHISDGYYYHFHYATPHTIYFRCQHMRTCNGRSVFKISNGFQHTQPHSHAPDMLYPQIQAARAGIIDRARSMVYMSFSEIVRSEKRGIQNEQVRSHLTVRNLRSAMHRARGSVYPTIPQGVPELSLILEDPAWEYLTQTCDLQDSIYLGTAVARDFSMHVVFMSSRCLAYLRLANIVFADGTFYITPSVEGSYQVFTLVTIQGHTVIPLCWSLMQSKSQPAYESVLTLIRTHLGEWSFTKVVCDFEDAIINAFRLVFNVDTQGCLFHSADAMARHAKAMYGINLIHLHYEVEIVIMLCCALPLLPAHLLQRGLNAIGDAAIGLGVYLYEILRPFLFYMQHDWLDHANRGICMSVCGSEHRTNNASETINRRMRRKFSTPHPNIFQFIRTVAVFEGESMDDLASLQRGLIPSRHRNVTAVTNDRLIIRITNDLLSEENPSDESILNFLMTASLSILGLVTEALE